MPVVREPERDDGAQERDTVVPAMRARMDVDER